MFSEEYLYEYTKCLEIIIMNLTAKNRSIKNEIYIYIYGEKKIKKKKERMD